MIRRLCPLTDVCTTNHEDLGIVKELFQVCCQKRFSRKPQNKFSATKYLRSLTLLLKKPKWNKRISILTLKICKIKEMKACSIFDRFLVNRKGLKKMTMTKVIATAMIGSNFLLKFSIESKVRWPGSDGLNQMAWITSLNWMSNPSKKCYTINILILDRLIASTNSDVTSRPLSLLVLSTSLALCAWIIDNQEIFRTAVHCSRGWGEKKVGRNRRAELSPLYSHPVPCQPFQPRSGPFSRTIRIHFKTFKVKPYRVSCAVTRFLKFLNPSGFEVIIVLTPPQTNAI